MIEDGARNRTAYTKVSTEALNKRRWRWGGRPDNDTELCSFALVRGS
jgi:hypothetical protein